jgi:VWFA-related protein
MLGQPWTDLTDAAITFVALLNQYDRAEIIDFSDSPAVMQGFTTDKAALNAAINANYAAGMTALYDACALGITETKAQGGRGAVLLMTDGWENASTQYADLNSLLTYARQSGVPVFTIGLGQYIDSTSLQAIANATGGIYVEAPSSGQLQAVYQRIRQQLGAQIQMAFTSPNPNVGAGTRRLDVQLNYGPLQALVQKNYSH